MGGNHLPAYICDWTQKHGRSHQGVPQTGRIQLEKGKNNAKNPASKGVYQRFFFFFSHKAEEKIKGVQWTLGGVSED